jgi:RNA polymerase sigma-B factor
MSSKKACRQNEALETAVLSYLDTGSPEEKEAVVKAGEALVNYYAGIYSPGRTDEDLRQAGYEGLLKALKRYNPQRGVMFSTFATHCIIGEIRHDLRLRGPFKVPDWLKSLQGRVLDATEELAQKNGCMPTLAEIARKVNVAEEGIVEAMQAGCVSFDEVDITKVKNLRYENFKLPIEDKITVQMSLEKIDDVQKKVITLIYYEGLTQEQAAKELGINQRKVSRILGRGLNEMRAYVV